MCPNAVENYQAVVDYVLPEAWLKNLDEANKVAGEAVRFLTPRGPHPHLRPRRSRQRWLAAAEAAGGVGRDFL